MVGVIVVLKPQIRASVLRKS